MTEQFQFAKIRRPTVTTCCAGGDWAETNQGTFCYKCKKLSDRRLITDEEFSKIIGRMPEKGYFLYE